MMINCYTHYALSRLEKTPALRPAFYKKRSAFVEFELTRSFLKDSTFLYDWTPFLQVRAKKRTISVHAYFWARLLKMQKHRVVFRKNTARFS